MLLLVEERAYDKGSSISTHKLVVEINKAKKKK
jgi:hypothetical protein